MADTHDESRQLLWLPWPPSQNKYWRNVRGRMVLAKAGRDYKKAVKHQVHEQIKFHYEAEERINVTLHVSPPDRRRRDLDNIPKAVLDSMEDVGLYDDDSQVDKLEIIRYLPDTVRQGKILFEVSAASELIELKSIEQFAPTTQTIPWSKTRFPH